MTTYIKRVPQFKAVQFQISKESYNAIRNLSPGVWSDMNCKMISQRGGMTITFNAEHGRIITASEGDWVVRELDSTLSVMSDEDFKAQYEAAPERMMNSDDLEGMIAKGLVRPIKVTNADAFKKEFAQAGMMADAKFFEVLITHRIAEDVRTELFNKWKGKE